MPAAPDPLRTIAMPVAIEPRNRTFGSTDEASSRSIAAQARIPAAGLPR